MSRKQNQQKDSGALIRLEDIPNVGKAIAADLRMIGINNPDDLAGRDPFSMYDDLCQITNTRQDPCVIDVFMAAVSFMNGEPVRHWWEFTAERKRHLLDADSGSH